MYSLRPATYDDYDFVYQLHVAAMREYIEATWGWDEAWQQAYFQQKFDPSKRQVVLVGGVEAGVLVVEQRSDELYVGLIELLPQYQRRGVGTAIIRDLMQMAGAAGVPLGLHVLKTNQPARRLYERLGFRIMEEMEERYKMVCLPYNREQ